jgi:mannosyltransferase
VARGKLTGGCRSDPVYCVGLAVSAVALSTASAFLLARPVLLHRFILPFAEAFLSADRIIEQNTVTLLDGLLVKTGSVALLLGIVALCYSFIWRYLGSRLPDPRHDALRPSVPPVTRLEICFLTTAMVVALMLRLPHVTRGLIYDEIYSAIHFIDVESIWQTISSYAVFNNHIAYSILARFSQAVFGPHEWALRLPALLLGLGSVYCMWAVGRRFLRPRVAVAATFGLALSPVHVMWSVSARGYTGIILFTFVSSYLYFELLNRPTRFRAFTFILSSVAGIYFHLYAALVTLVQLLFLLSLASREILTERGGRLLDARSFSALWLSFTAIIPAALACYSPVFQKLVSNINRYGRSAFKPLFPLDVIEYLAGSTWERLAIPVVLVLVVALISLRRPRSKEVSYWLLLYFVPVLTTWLVRPSFLYPRFFVYLLPYCVLLATLGCFTLWGAASSLSRGLARYFLQGLCLACVVSVLFAWAVNSRNYVPTDGFRDAVRTMERDATQLTGFCAIGGGAQLFQYYSERDIMVLGSMEGLQQFVERYPEVRCAYRHKLQDTPERRRMIEFLSENATAQQIQNVTVFTYQR